MANTKLLQKLTKRCFGFVGLDVRFRKNLPVARAAEKSQAVVDRWSLIRRYKPGAVFDIGANEGQFAVLVRTILPDVPIYSFEPLEDCFRVVEKFLLNNGPGQAFQFALGETSESILFHRNRFTPSSSLLPMKQLHKDEFPQSDKTVQEQIQIRRLDEIVSEIEFVGPLVVKVDVQGYEDRVIRGGQDTFRQAHAVILELTSYPLYEDQATFPAVHQQMTELGFIFRGVIDQLHSPRDQRILQFDGVFENSRFLP